MSQPPEQQPPADVMPDARELFLRGDAPASEAPQTGAAFAIESLAGVIARQTRGAAELGQERIVLNVEHPTPIYAEVRDEFTAPTWRRDPLSERRANLYQSRTPEGADGALPYARIRTALIAMRIGRTHAQRDDAVRQSTGLQPSGWGGWFLTGEDRPEPVAHTTESVVDTAAGPVAVELTGGRPAEAATETTAAGAIPAPESAEPEDAEAAAAARSAANIARAFKATRGVGPAAEPEDAGPPRTPASERYLEQLRAKAENYAKLVEQISNPANRPPGITDQQYAEYVANLISSERMARELYEETRDKGVEVHDSGVDDATVDRFLRGLRDI